MDSFTSLASARRGELLVHSFTGVVPARCDAEAGEHEEVVLDPSVEEGAEFRGGRVTR